MTWLAVLLFASCVSGDEAALAAWRASIEHVLATAPIVEMEAVNQGISRPLKVRLDLGDGRRLKAIFKSIDTNMKAKARHGSETADRYIDSYRSEIAAYELDKLVGLGRLPVIVERKVDGRKGSLREWIDDVRPRYGPGPPLPTDDRLERWMHTFWLFDYLVYNVDRGAHNVMLASDWSPVNIDNSMTFNTYVTPIRPLYRFPRGVIDRLRALEDRDLKRALGRYLNGRQLRALRTRIDRVLSTADRQIEAEGASTVLYELDP